jgi:hypothetical protein
VRILWELWACFPEVRILKNLERKTERRKCCGAEATALRRQGEELQKEEESGKEEGVWLDRDGNIKEGSMELADR